MKHSKSSLFLMELIISILFFSLASAVCIRLFAKAHLTSEDTVNKNNAITQSQNLAEIWLSADGDFQVCSEVVKQSYAQNCAEFSSKELSLFFGENWDFCTSADAVYAVRLQDTTEASNGLNTVSIVVYSIKSPNDTIFTLDLKHHVAKRRGDNE